VVLRRNLTWTSAGAHLEKTHDNAALKPLTQLALGQSAPLHSIRGPEPLVERLFEIGFLPGETVTLQGRAPLKGPWIVALRGITIALRTQEAECLLV
jgi:Fe2+ transport system protein FeoA